jgi:hypothetical protein
VNWWKLKQPPLSVPARRSSRQLTGLFLLTAAGMARRIVLCRGVVSRGGPWASLPGRVRG